MKLNKVIEKLNEKIASQEETVQTNLRLKLESERDMREATSLTEIRKLADQTIAFDNLTRVHSTYLHTMKFIVRKITMRADVEKLIANLNRDLESANSNREALEKMQDNQLHSIRESLYADRVKSMLFDYDRDSTRLAEQCLIVAAYHTTIDLINS